MKYDYMTQTELLEQFQRYTEFLAAQQQTTQLIILIIIFLLVGGTIAFLALRGGIQVFSRLSSAIDKLADIETERHETQKDLVKAVKGFSQQNSQRYEKVDEIWHEVLDKIDKLNARFEDFYMVLEKLNPVERERVIDLLNDIKANLEDTKQKTDEIEAIPT